MNWNISTVALISCLLITTCLAGCLEDDDDDKTETDFYGEEYWAVNGFAYTFEEDGIKYTLHKIDGDCDVYEEEMGSVLDSSGDYCILDLDFFEYSSEDKGDYYEICVKEDSDSDNDCINVYPLSDGMVIENDDDCSIFVSDISRPILEDGDLEDDWEDDWRDVAEDIYDDDDAPNCEYDLFLAPENEGGGLEIYQFAGRDAAGSITDDINTQDDLVYVKMTQGSELNWSRVGISITVDDGQSYYCGEWREDSAEDCTYTVNGDQHWEVPFEIMISEGSQNLCAPTDKAYCSIEVTITKIGVGDEDSKTLAEESVIAE